MKRTSLLLAAVMAAVTLGANARADAHGAVADAVIAEQRANLGANTKGKGFGPQSPRDIDAGNGTNTISFNPAPAYSKMNLCNIHFHRYAEHKGGEYTKYAGNGDGKGKNTGYVYAGQLTEREAAPIAQAVCAGKYGGLQSGDTIETHYVHSSAQVKPGPTLGACLNEAIKNPQLRVEAQVYVLVNDSAAMDFAELARHGKRAGFYQALNIPGNTGTPVVYAGSTTGPGYNEAGSPFQVTWSVRPGVAKVNIDSVGKWCQGNAFNEDHAHGVRNLVIQPALLSPIQ